MNKLLRANYSLKELKTAPSESAEMLFSGYAAVFNVLDAYGDMIVPGAFSRNLADIKAGKHPWPAMLLQHGGWGLSPDDVTPIGIWTDLLEDDVGLKVEGKLADTPRGRELYELMRMEPRPAITGLSIGYIAKEWEPRSKPEEPRRKLKRLELWEISPVTFPANQQARVESVKTIRQAEEVLREAGFSRQEAKMILAKGWQGLSCREGEEEAEAPMVYLEMLQAATKEYIEKRRIIHGN